MTFRKRLPFMLISVFILSFILMGYQRVVNPEYSNGQKVERIGIPGQDMFSNDPVMNLLGKSFDEIKQVLGEPDEQGYSQLLGQHHYILFQQKQGAVQFSSPVPIKNKIAVSIILGPGQEVLGVKVGMLFSEIKDILGTPNFDSELGMDNLYYMDYYFGETKNQIPEVFLSFSANAINGPTQEAFIKWDGFEYNQIKILQVQR